MAHSTDINLPRSHVPSFPDECVVCEQDHPGGHVRVIAGTLGWWTYLLGWLGTPFVVKAPACRNCAWKLQAQRVASVLITIIVGLAVLFWIWPNIKDSIPPSVHRWAFGGICVLCLLPMLWLQVCYPPPFSIMAYSNSVDYQFRSMRYALEFVAWNKLAPWVKVNGTPVRLPSEGSEPRDAADSR